jgi:hypothetical protein
MRKFIYNTLIFLFILSILVFTGLFLPATPRISNSLFFAENNKDLQLSKVSRPRIIFIGGSNLSFGLNSQMIKDSLKLNPINTGLHQGIGLEYMLDHYLNKIKSGDIVVVSPEYHQFYDKNSYGGEELLPMVFDVTSFNLNKIKFKQWQNIYKFIPSYSLSKFLPFEYYGFTKSNIYSVYSFNEFGDVFTHWKLSNQKITAVNAVGENFNFSIITDLKKFQKNVLERGALLYITFPGFQATSFEKCKNQIKQIEHQLKINGFTILGTPEKYKIPDDMMFDTIYHLSKKGVDFRTNLLILDIRNANNLNFKKSNYLI